MTVETMLFIWSMVGVEIRSLSSAITVNAVLSSTTTLSALRASRFRVSNELYGWTTTSDWYL
jgi:hypothetical protein